MESAGSASRRGGDPLSRVVSGSRTFAPDSAGVERTAPADVANPGFARGAVAAAAGKSVGAPAACIAAACVVSPASVAGVSGGAVDEVTGAAEPIWLAADALRGDSRAASPVTGAADRPRSENGRVAVCGVAVAIGSAVVSPGSDAVMSAVEFRAAGPSFEGRALVRPEVPAACEVAAGAWTCASSAANDAGASPADWTDATPGRPAPRSAGACGLAGARSGGEMRTDACT
jgi:hypothetical protein